MSILADMIESSLQLGKRLEEERIARYNRGERYCNNPECGEPLETDLDKARGCCYDCGIEWENMNSLTNEG